MEYVYRHRYCDSHHSTSSTVWTVIVARWTIRWLKSVEPQRRLLWAAQAFWWTVALGLLSVIFLCHTWFERILMIISWGAITITCVDIIATSDVRDEEERL